MFAGVLGLHSVEARHAGYLNQLTGTVPFPDVVDTPKTTDEVVDVAGRFIDDPATMDELVEITDELAV